MLDAPPQFKFIVIGASGAGKTSIVRRLTEGKFVPGTQSTVGIEYFTHVTTIEGQTVKLMIWDTAGQERFYTIAKAYFRSALGVILVFDICDRKSFESLPRWLRDARMEADTHCSIFVVGNKLDLAPKRAVSAEEGEEFAKAQGLQYVETSAAEDVKIEEVFLRATTDLLRKVASGEVSGGGGAQGGGTGVKLLPSDSSRKEKDECPC
jgi:small GTP-binding protein